MLPDASISFDNTSGKSVASDSVGLVVSASSCSFLLMVDEVINKQCHRPNLLTTRTLFAPSPYE